MSKKSICSQKYRHPVLGDISIKALKSARRVTARWKSSDLLSVTVPYGIGIEEFMHILESMQPAILRNRPKSDYFVPGWRYVTPEYQFRVIEGEKSDIISRTNDSVNKIITFYLPTDCCPDGSKYCNEWINRNLNDYARIFAEPNLIPLAYSIAERLGVSPRSIDISYGQKVLGRCNSRHEILLSRNLVFYPEDLREYVIAHEFAHLTYMNHSGAFYALLNRYVGGRHSQLCKALNAHKLPFKQ